VVSLVRGRVLVPDGTVERVAAALPESAAPTSAAANPAATHPAPTNADGTDPDASSNAGRVSRIELPWPGDVPHGGRHGYLHCDREGFNAAATRAAARLESVIGAATRVLVLGTEELMYLPLRLALELARDPRRQVAYQSTTRSPVHAIDQPGYPIRRRIDFLSRMLGELDKPPVGRFVYNAYWPDGGTEICWSEADLVVIVDDGHAQPGPAGLAAAVAATTGAPVLLAVLR